MFIKRRILEAVKLIASVSLILAVTFAVWLMYRGGQKMPVAEAGEISFWEFTKNITTSAVEDGESKKIVASLGGCRLTLLKALPDNFLASWRYARASLRAQKTTAPPPQNLQPKNFVLHVSPINLAQAPDAFWEYFFTLYWQGFTENTQVGAVCAYHPAGSVQVNAETVIPLTGTDSQTVVHLPTRTPVPLAAVSGTGKIGLRIRNDPGLESFYTVVVHDGDLLQVIEGPVEADGMTWWKVELLEDFQVSGWCAGEYLEWQ